VNGADQFHIGVIVDDFDATLVEWTELFGYEWCPPLDVQTPVVLPERELMMLDLRFTYSATTPRVEIVQAIAGTLWMPAEGSGIHHVGYWSDDLASDAARLEAQGYVTEAKGVRPDGALAWAYHKSQRGPRIELVSRELQPGMEQYWASA